MLTVTILEIRCGRIISRISPPRWCPSTPPQLPPRPCPLPLHLVSDVAHLSQPQHLSVVADREAGAGGCGQGGGVAGGEEHSGCGGGGDGEEGDSERLSEGGAGVGQRAVQKGELCGGAWAVRRGVQEQQGGGAHWAQTPPGCGGGVRVGDWVGSIVRARSSVALFSSSSGKQPNGARSSSGSSS